MKTRFFALFVAGLGLLAVGQPASAGQPAHAAGGVVYENQPGSTGATYLEFNGRGTPTDATGIAHVRNVESGADYEAHITCYAQQSETTARMTGYVTKGNRTGYFTLTVTDNGEGSSSAPDLVAVNRRPNSPYDCAAPRTGQRTVLHGNLQVLGGGTFQQRPFAAPTGDYTTDEISD